ncbi:MAG TPA: AAA family ATPase [Eubacteriaceae bacterium]|nr:AAA family ATPase [Eubacteriaceae bacterium]
MKLKSAYLQAYGKFINKKLEFGPNINLIYGDNEGGKSTIAEFIFAMFYGQKKYGVKRRIYTPIHSFNRPWSHPLYQGILTYSLNKEEFRIERNFHNDFEEIKIYNLRGEDITNNYKFDSRMESEFFKEQIGLNERIFKNTIYLSQNDMEGSLYSNKENLLKEILAQTIYGVEVDQGEKTIGEAIAQLEKSKRDIGTINNKNKPLGRSYQLLRENLEIKYQIENKMDQDGQYRQSLKEIEDKKNKLIEKKSKLNIYKNHLNNQEIKRKIDLIENLIIQIKEIEEYIKENFDHNIKENSLEDIKIKRIKNQKRIKTLIGLIIGWIFLGGATLIWALIATKLIYQGPILLAIIIFLIQNIIRLKSLTKNNEILFNQLEATGKYQDAYYELKYLQEKQEDEIGEFSLDQLKKKIQPLEGDIDFSNIDADANTVDIMLRQLENELIQLNNEKIALNVRIEENNWEPDRLEQVELDINNLKNTIEDLEEQVEAIDIAIATLKEIESSGNSQWLPPLIKKTQENIYKITKKYHTIKIDEESQIKTLDPLTEKLVPIDQLSKGTFNQFYFALRISMIQGISPLPIKLAIILDEPFINFDNKRFEESMNLLKELSQDHQILIFSSQARERAYLDKNNWNYNYIEL